MKIQLLALSLIAAPGLFAKIPMRQTENQPNCNECCCNPCCCTNPRPCIDCECYVPQFYSLQCDWGFSFDAEFLYWYARESNLSYAARLPMVEIPGGIEDFAVTGVGERKHFSTSWTPGLRLGIGFNSSCDGWDYNLIWTWYQNRQSNSVAVDEFILDGNTILSSLGNAGDFILVNPWTNEGCRVFFVNNYDQIRARYRLRFNQIDLDLGRKYWLSECFNLRPFIGLRGVWTKVRFSTTSSRDATSEISTIFEAISNDQFRTRSWGVGLIGGIDPTWYFSRCLALFGKVNTGVLWGDFELRKRENYFFSLAEAGEAAIPISYSGSGSDTHAQMFAMLDLALGLRWERTWCCDRYRTAIDLGWEHHILFDQNHRYKSLGMDSNQGASILALGYDKYVVESGNLGLGGFVLRINWDF